MGPNVNIGPSSGLSEPKTGDATTRAPIAEAFVPFAIADPGFMLDARRASDEPIKAFLPSGVCPQRQLWVLNKYWSSGESLRRGAAERPTLRRVT